jgi:hypothetical protein
MGVADMDDAADQDIASDAYLPGKMLENLFPAGKLHDVETLWPPPLSAWTGLAGSPRKGSR